jgi:hypothetical protein
MNGIGQNKSNIRATMNVASHRSGLIFAISQGAAGTCRGPGHERVSDVWDYCTIITLGRRHVRRRFGWDAVNCGVVALVMIAARGGWECSAAGRPLWEWNVTIHPPRPEQPGPWGPWTTEPRTDGNLARSVERAHDAS